jgi:hypothetical protein
VLYLVQLAALEARFNLNFLNKTEATNGLPLFFYSKIAFVLLGLLLLQMHASAQSYHRISGDFTQKYKSTDGKQVLIKGRFYFDVKYKKAVYDITFPESQIWVFEDTVQRIFKGDTLFASMPMTFSNEFSIFHLSLTQRLDNYGLQESVFHLEKTEVQNDMVVSYWKPQQALSKQVGRVVLSKKNKQLYGVLFYDPAEVLIRKQFFRNYSHVMGINFPMEVIDIFYRNGNEVYQKTEYKNIIINEPGKDNRYRFRYAV